MSTNSSIWIQNADGTFEGIYCHWDGYIDGVGATLAHHYTDECKVRNLISLGAISSLEERTGVAFLPQDHTFDTPVSGFTIAYHRDRGDGLVIYKENNQAATLQEEYNYVFINGLWYVAFDGTNGKYETVGSHLE